MKSFLTALPVFNEAPYVDAVLDQVVNYSPQVLVVDDGSSDGTAELLSRRSDIQLLTHPQNRGYGAALRSAFQYAAQQGFEYLVTIDCDGQHEPQRIPSFVAACETTDIVSGSRYLEIFPEDSEPPAQRRWVNQQITAELNQRLGLQLSDAFCGFKAYRVDAVCSLHLDEDGYAMPLQLWVQAAARELKIVEHPVPLIYLDETRSFGGILDDARTRLEHYHEVIDKSVSSALAEGLKIHRQSYCRGETG
ncbi:MAG TPA: glycosyltransferase family 2 protein [Planctomycetaceae bacterium]|nr:glycosyltransferase family 2 protein [Planctomycetaceae bacterium]